MDSPDPNEEFDEPMAPEAPEQQTRAMRSPGRRRGGGGGGQSAEERKRLMIRRAIALGVGLLILILVVVGVRGCLDARKNRSL